MFTVILIAIITLGKKAILKQYKVNRFLKELILLLILPLTPFLILSAYKSKIGEVLE
jgi:polyferredoxin